MIGIIENGKVTVITETLEESIAYLDEMVHDYASECQTEDAEAKYGNRYQ